MYTTEITTTIRLTPEEYENREELIRDLITMKCDEDGFKRLNSKGGYLMGIDKYKMPRFQFDANTNAYYCTLKLFRQ